MKKIFLLLFLTIFSLFLLDRSNTVSAATEVNYSANFAAGLPSDWLLYDKSAKSQTTVSNNNRSVSITHSGYVAAANYYGALYQINPNSLNEVGDFTLQMKFTVLSYEDMDRWFGIMYHTKLDESNNLTGYMMNYRVRGKSAQSTISMSSGAATFADSLIKDNAGNALNDNAVHTLKIVCEGSKVSHYMDENLIITYDYKNYSNGLSKVHTNGGFALIVNKMNLKVTSLTINGEITKEKEIDNFITVTYDQEDGLVGEISAAIKATSKEKLQSLVKGDVKPATAILYIDENMNVCDENNNSLNISLKDVYLDYLYQRIIPAVYIKNNKIAEKFITYYKENINILDAFVVSDDPNIVKIVREELYYIRGIIDYSNKNISKSDWKDIVATSNSSFANVIILNPNDASYEAIRWIQARFKTVWIDNDEMSTTDVYEQVANGVYGIICDNFEFVYSTISNIKEDVYAMNRVPYNIAHRGLCFTYAENSLEGYIASYENGASHIEIDIRLTKDNQIIVMHDATIDRTTNGTGEVKNMTLTEIKKHKIDTYYERTPITDSSKYTTIPSLDQVFNEFQNKDIVLVVEIKSYEEELVKELKRLIDAYDMADNVVVITFSAEQLVNMKNILPEIPTASLTSVEESVFANTLTMMATSNCGYDGHYGTSTPSYIRKLAVRGYSTWFWTYQREENIWVGMYSGTLGITNNEANEIADYAVRIVFENDVLVSKDNSYSNVTGTIQKYDSRFNENKTVSIAQKEEFDGYAYVIYKYMYNNGNRYYVVYSDKVLVLTKSLNDDIQKLDEILAKNVKDLTDSEVEVLERINEISLELETHNVSGVNSEQISEMLLNYKNNSTNNDQENNDNNNDNGNTPAPDDNQSNNENNPSNENNDKQSPTLIGCSGSIITSVFGLLTLAAAVIVLKKKNKI